MSAAGYEHSTDLSGLAEALALAQAAIKGAAADETGQSGRGTYKYANLAAVWDACRKPLSDNGLSVVQLGEPSEAGTIALTTVLMHKSGQFISGTEVIRLPQDTAQGYGSAMTYARRYGLAAMVGVCPDDDDDGAEASKPRTPATQNVRPVQATPPAQAAAAYQAATAAPQPATSVAVAPQTSAVSEPWDTVVAEANKDQGKWFLAKVTETWATITGAAGIGTKLGDPDWRKTNGNRTFEYVYGLIKQAVEREDAALFEGKAATNG